MDETASSSGNRNETIELNNRIACAISHDGTWPNRSEPDGPSRNLAHESSELSRTFQKLQEEVKNLHFMRTNIEPSSTLDIQIRVSGLQLDTIRCPVSVPATSSEQHTGEERTEQVQRWIPPNDMAEQWKRSLAECRDAASRIRQTGRPLNDTAEGGERSPHPNRGPLSYANRSSFRHLPRADNVRPSTRAERRSMLDMALLSDRDQLKFPRSRFTQTYKLPPMYQEPPIRQSLTVVNPSSLARQSRPSEQLWPTPTPISSSVPGTDRSIADEDFQPDVEPVAAENVTGSSCMLSSTEAQVQTTQNELPSHITAPKSKHVLIVDDNKISQVISTKMIEKRLGFSATAVDNGQEGVQRYTADPSRWHAIIIALTGMPDGPTAASLIRAYEQDRRIEDAESRRVMIIGKIAYQDFRTKKTMEETKIDHLWIRPQAVGELEAMFKGGCRCLICSEKSQTHEQGV